jgi:hypothetical protein
MILEVNHDYYESPTNLATISISTNKYFVMFGQVWSLTLHLSSNARKTLPAIIQDLDETRNARRLAPTLPQ